jgi:hypothetical protein
MERQIPPRPVRVVDPQDRELLTGMGNCFEACGEDFDGTVGMVASARHRTPDSVREALARLRATHLHDPEYQGLRARLPPEFPL